MKKQPLIEVCATSIHSCLAAQDGGAKRVELCDNLYEGGTTPGPGTLQLARELLDIEIMVMIRPRGGDFCYTKLEFEIMKKDIQACKEMGADGVVFGILLPDGNIDIERTKELVELSRPLKVTHHRAFDMTPDPYRAMEEIIDLGMERILTSGHKNTVPEGKELIAQLIKRANDRIIIMPGSGISEENILEMKKATGAHEFHLTGRKKKESKMQFRKEGIFMGGLPQIPEYEISVTDENRIRKVVNILNADKN